MWPIDAKIEKFPRGNIYLKPKTMYKAAQDQGFYF